MASVLRLGLIQLSVSAHKAANLERAALKVREAVEKHRCHVVCLPECFNSPYGTNHFPEYAESVDGDTATALARMAADNECVLVGGSFPERRNEELFNTCTVFDQRGNMLGSYRKTHLFDIDIPGKIRFCESDSLSPGPNFLTVDIEPKPSLKLRVGIGICYDVRFPEFSSIYAREKDCQLLLFPGAFNMTTGPMHWELLARARAVDNQVYVGMCSPARDEQADYVAWGHSCLVDPMGRVLASTGDKEDIVVADIETSLIQQVRNQIPVTKQKRLDLYTPAKSKI